MRGVDIQMKKSSKEHKEAVPSLNEYRLLGKSGLRVSPLCLGTMNFGTNWSSWMGEITKDEAGRIFDLYTSKGGNFIDTANKYQNGQAEEWLGEFIQAKGNRDELVLASKFALPMKSKNGRFNVNLAGNHRKNMFASIEASLKRLGTHYLDIYYVHFHDYTTTPEEMMRALDDLVRSGKVHYVAISDAPAWHVARCNTLAELRGWSPFIGYQGRYHIGERDLERDILPMCQEMGVGVIPWGVLGQGKFTGKYKRGEPTEIGGRKGVKMTERDYQIAETVEAIAEEIGRTPSQVVLNWAIQQPGITSPLIGARTVQQAAESIEALDFVLRTDQVERLNSMSTIDLGFPHNFLGGTHDYHNSPWLKDGGVIV